MVKIIHRPDPQPDVDSNRAVRKTDTFLNREASAGLFQRALVKAQGQEHAVEHSKLAGSSQQQQIESDARTVLGTKTREGVLASQSESNVSHQGTELNAVEASDVAGMDENLGESTDTDTDDELDQLGQADQADKSEQDAGFAGSSAAFDSSAAYQMFENINQQSNSAEPEQQHDANPIGDNTANAQDATETAQAAVAHSAVSTATSMESRIDTLSGMSDLIDMLETSSQLPTGNEWTLILEDDGPVSELKLSSDSDGRWNIDLLTSFDNDAVDETLIGDLRNKLNTAGVAVANIELVDSALIDRALADDESTDLSSVNQVSAKGSSTNNVA